MLNNFQNKYYFLSLFTKFSYNVLFVLRSWQWQRWKTIQVKPGGMSEAKGEGKETPEF